MTRELAWGPMVTGQIDTCITDSSLDGVDSPIILKEKINLSKLCMDTNSAVHCN